jgi:hypothetical protein
VSAIREAPASIGQRLLWLMERYRGFGGTLNSHLLYRIRGPLDLPRMRAAIELVVSRHESLRTTYGVAEARPVRMIHEPGPVHVEEIDLRRSANAEAALSGEIARQLADRLKLDTETLRYFSYRLGAEDHALSLITHHLSTDGWSTGVISREIGDAYRHLSGEIAEMPHVAWQYSDFVEWQRARLADDRLPRVQEAWRSQLEGLELPRLPVTPSGGSGSSIEWEWIRPETLAALRTLAPRLDTTPFVLLLSAFYTLLYRQSGQRDLAVASLMANRGHPKSRSTVGFLANMVILRTRFASARTLPDLVREVTRTAFHALRNQELPYQLLPRDLFADLTGRPDDVVFQMLSHDSLGLAISGLDIAPIPPPRGTRHRFTLEFLLVPSRGDGVHVMVRYASDRFAAPYVRALASDYQALVERLAEDPDIPIGG